jgi:hypothetical protein
MPNAFTHLWTMCPLMSLKRTTSSVRGEVVWIFWGHSTAFLSTFMSSTRLHFTNARE